MLYDKECIMNLCGNDIIIPLVVLEEIDKFKTREGILGENARAINRFLDEIREIGEKGVDVNSENFMISEAANLILPFHREMDEIREDAAGKSKIGTTRRGIGPAYEDKVGRRSIRVMDLLSLIHI